MLLICQNGKGFIFASLINTNQLVGVIAASPQYTFLVDLGGNSKNSRRRYTMYLYTLIFCGGANKTHHNFGVNPLKPKKHPRPHTTLHWPPSSANPPPPPCGIFSAVRLCRSPRALKSLRQRWRWGRSPAPWRPSRRLPIRRQGFAREVVVVFSFLCFFPGARGGENQKNREEDSLCWKPLVGMYIVVYIYMICVYVCISLCLNPLFAFASQRIPFAETPRTNISPSEWVKPGKGGCGSQPGNITRGDQAIWSWCW